MKTARWFWMVSIVVCIFWAGAGWALDQPPVSCPLSGTGCAQMGEGMMQPGMHGMMPEMHKGPMHAGHDVCDSRQLMGALHHWASMLMAHRKAIGLSPEQIDKLDDAITKHITYSIGNMAECRMHRVELGRELRKKTIDLQAVEALLKKIGDQDVKLQMEGIKLYIQVLGMLTAPQRAKVDEIIGTPFPAPWEETPMKSHMGMPGPHFPYAGAPSSNPQKSGAQPEHHGQGEQKAE